MKIRVCLIVFSCLVFIVTGCSKKSYNTNNNEDNYQKNEIIDFTDENLKNNLLQTKKVVVFNEFSQKIDKIITKSDLINDFIQILMSGTKVDSEFVTTESFMFTISLYDKNDKIITTINYWKSGYFGFEKKEYSLNIDYNNKILKIIN